MPNRIIKESITTSDTIDQLSADEERLFLRLTVVCDDYGRFDGKPALVKARCFPLKDFDNATVAEWLSKLQAVGLIRFYVAEGKLYIDFTTWEKHQNPRAKYSKCPDPQAICPLMAGSEIMCWKPASSVTASAGRPSAPVSNPSAIVAESVYPNPGVDIRESSMRESSAPARADTHTPPPVSSPSGSEGTELAPTVASSMEPPAGTGETSTTAPGIQAEAQTYLDAYRSLYANPKAQMSPDAFARFREARQTMDLPELLERLRGLASDDGFGRGLGVKATLHPENLSQGLQLARAPPKKSRRPDNKTTLEAAIASGDHAQVGHRRGLRR